MKRSFDLLIVFAVLLTASIGCAHWSDPCDDKLVERIPSPDGSVVLSTYHRECASKIYTTASIEKPPGRFGSRGEVVCYLMSWGDRHPIVAKWESDENISISTTDRLEEIDLGSGGEDSCGKIRIAYQVPRRNETQTTTDAITVEKIRRALSETGPCINAYYKSANPNNDPFGRMRSMIDDGHHRSAVENIIAYSRDAGCQISKETYRILAELTETFDLKPRYRDDLEKLVSK